ncbi:MULTISPECIES: cupin domain-containing protein [Janibacter]|uniref:Helix-turn-helix domain-containing protein n=1 Tax=Janibacter melonis TaxID=262209 RepID=A0A5P8FNH2_9MICO|nr:cupin domain-containing protein [Janibacter melonis]MCB5991588.1 helix-turn-helix domain-containing protein [Janibacter melonis]QFQ31126.1 helix-turn-helix domain-containing protein [Janibacter melonis]
MGAERTDEGALSEGFLAQVGARVRSARTEQGLTVQQLADRAEISRRLLTQVEHGQANPSLVSITRVARALGTELTELLDPLRPSGAISVVEAGAEVLVWSDEGGSSAHLLVATSHGRAADLWRWRLEPGAGYQGLADPAGSQELFHVLEGELTLTADDDRVVVRAGSSARLLSDRAYRYANAGATACVFVRTVALSGAR